MIYVFAEPAHLGRLLVGSGGLVCHCLFGDVDEMQGDEVWRCILVVGWRYEVGFAFTRWFFWFGEENADEEA